MQKSEKSVPPPLHGQGTGDNGQPESLYYFCHGIALLLTKNFPLDELFIHNF
jgi:hypothetical protein